MNKLLLVDGHNLPFQMLIGMPARIINEQGKAIQASCIIQSVKDEYTERG